MSEQKFKVGDKVMDNARFYGKVGVVTFVGILIMVDGFSDGETTHEPHTLIHAKPLSDLWEDEATCRKIAELFFGKEIKFTVPLWSEDSDVNWIEGVDNRFEDFSIGISNSGKLDYRSNLQKLSPDFFKLSQLLTEAGYYPEEP